MGNEPTIPVGRYLANRFDWAAPGDQQQDAWLVRFCDKDCGEAIFTGPDAEREAWEYWNRYAPSYNLYVFRLAALRPSARNGECERALEQLRQSAAKLAPECDRLADAVPVVGEVDPLWWERQSALREAATVLRFYARRAALSADRSDPAGEKA